MMRLFFTSALFTLFFIREVFGMQVPNDENIAWFEGFFVESNSHPFSDSLNVIQERLVREKQRGDWKAAAHTLKEMGLLNVVKTHDYDKAMDFFIKALAIEDSVNLKEKKIFTYLAIAHVFAEVGYYNKSEQLLKQALELNDEFNNIDNFAFIVLRLGKMNAANEHWEEAFQNFQRVLEFKEEINNPAVEAEALFNLAHLYIQEKKYDKAIVNYKQALAIWRSLKDRMHEARSLSDIGALYVLMKNEARALANYKAAFEISESLGDKRGIAESLNNLGALYFRQGNYNEAIANFEKALLYAHESDASEQIKKSYEYLSWSYKELKEYERALDANNKFLSIYDLIQNEKSERQLLETQNRYILDKRESQIDKLESDRKQRERALLNQRKVRNFLIALVGLGVIVVVLIFYSYLQKQRSNKRLQDLNAMKDKFFSIISHDLKGPLNSLTSFSGLLMNHTDSLSKEEIQMLAKDLDQSVKNLFALLENLLEWSRSQTGTIEYKPELFELSKLLNENIELLKGQANNKNIRLENTFREEILVNVHRQSISTVVRNLLSNAIKFTTSGGTVTIRVEKGKEDLVISIADSGVGMSQEVMKKLFRIDTKHSTKGTDDEKGTGLGLILCKEFVEKNGGRIWVNSEVGKGSVFSFSLLYK